MDLKSLYQSKELATFQNFSQGMFWFKTESGFEFPVPLDDFASARLPGQEKASMLWRYIDKHQKAQASGIALASPQGTQCSSATGVTFQSFYQGEFWFTTSGGFDFPISVADLTAAPNLLQGPAPAFDSYIESHQHALEAAKSAQAIQ